MVIYYVTPFTAVFLIQLRQFYTISKSGGIGVMWFNVCSIISCNHIILFHFEDHPTLKHLTQMICLAVSAKSAVTNNNTLYCTLSVSH